MRMSAVVRYVLYRMAATLEDLQEALAELEVDAAPKSTSIRLPEPLHRAVQIATELGMDESFTAATTHALKARVRSFARQQALAAHFAAYPEDVPSLAAVAHHRIRLTDHPGVSKPQLVDDVAAWYEQRWPGRVASGHVDEAVEEVLRSVELLAAGVGRRHRRTA